MDQMSIFDLNHRKIFHSGHFCTQAHKHPEQLFEFRNFVQVVSCWLVFRIGLEIDLWRENIPEHQCDCEMLNIKININE